jgi:hypothetical protein
MLHAAAHRLRPRQRTSKPQCQQPLVSVPGSILTKPDNYAKGVHTLPASLLRTQRTTRMITTGTISHKNTNGLVPGRGV